MYLALGITDDEGSGICTNSMLVKTKDAKEVANILTDNFYDDIKGECPFAQIFIIANGKRCPEVIEHYQAGKDYE